MRRELKKLSLEAVVSITKDVILQLETVLNNRCLRKKGAFEILILFIIAIFVTVYCNTLE